MQKQRKKNTAKRNSNGREYKGIFDYDVETAEESKKSKKQKKEKKNKSGNKPTENNIEEKFIGLKDINTQKRVKQLNKQKKKEKKVQQKNINELKKQEEKIQTRQIKKKLNNKQIEKIRRTKKIMKIIALLILSMIAIILLLLSPIFNVKKINIIGNERVSENEINSLININNDTNIFKESKRNITNKIKENSYIENVEIRRILPSTLEITVTERNVEYMLEFGSSYAYIDRQGYILEISTEEIEGKIKILGYVTSVENIVAGNRLCLEDLEKLNILSQVISAAKTAEISEIITSINIKDNNDFTMYIESAKKTVHVGDKSNLDTKLLYIKAILEREQGKEGEIFVNVDLNKKNPYFSENV